LLIDKTEQKGSLFMQTEQMLNEKAKELRREIVKMIGPNHTGHFGGSLSVVEIMTVLYFHEMKYDPRNPQLPGRDRLILSKGHSAPAQYAAMALAGFFPREELKTLKKVGSRLQGHPNLNSLAGIEANTGSLGQGLSMAIGMALAERKKQEKGRFYVIVGDGETQEGQVWEAAMAAANFGLNQITVIVDHNKLQATDKICNRMKIGDLRCKWEAFGWNAIEVDGHKVEELMEGFGKAEQYTDGPTAIIAHTIKGKGISFMENVPKYHNGSLNETEFEQALTELQ
jgi:transketolase